MGTIYLAFCWKFFVQSVLTYTWMLKKIWKGEKNMGKSEILKSYTLKIKTEVDFKQTLYWFDYLLMSVIFVEYLVNIWVL